MRLAVALSHPVILVLAKLRSPAAVRAPEAQRPAGGPAADDPRDEALASAGALLRLQSGL